MRLIYALAVAVVASGPAMAACNPGQAMNAERAAGAAAAAADQKENQARQAENRAERRDWNGNYAGGAKAEVNSQIAREQARTDEHRADAASAQAKRDTAGCY
jgi:hypothetical protein